MPIAFNFGFMSLLNEFADSSLVWASLVAGRGYDIETEALENINMFFDRSLDLGEICGVFGGCVGEGQFTSSGR